MTSRSSVYFISALVGAAVLWAALHAPNAHQPNAGSPAAVAPPAADSAAAAYPTDWMLTWTHIDPATPVRTFSMDGVGAVSRVINATPAGVLDTIPRPLVQWATRGIDRAALCTMKSSPADWRLEVSLTAAGRTCKVARSVRAWRRDERGRRVLAVVDSLEQIACRNRCSPFE